MNPDGTINEEVTRAKVPDSVPKDKADEIINKCKVLSKWNRYNIIIKYNNYIQYNNKIEYNNIKIKFQIILLISEGETDCETGMKVMKCYADMKTFSIL